MAQNEIKRAGRGESYVVRKAHILPEGVMWAFS
jgi:hypothetical protein